MLNERERVETYCCAADGNQTEERNTLRRQIGAEKVLSRLLMRRRSAGRQGIDPAPGSALRGGCT